MAARCRTSGRRPIICRWSRSSTSRRRKRAVMDGRVDTGIECERWWLNMWMEGYVSRGDASCNPVQSRGIAGSMHLREVGERAR
jgi:hypothetical protein